MNFHENLYFFASYSSLPMNCVQESMHVCGHSCITQKTAQTCGAVSMQIERMWSREAGACVQAEKTQASNEENTQDFYQEAEHTGGK